MHLQIFVYLLCRFLGENRIYTVQREKTVSQSEHFHAIGLFWSLKTVGVRAGMAIVSHKLIQDASLCGF
jgi:hypothetical protein